MNLSGMDASGMDAGGGVDLRDEFSGRFQVNCIATTSIHVVLGLARVYRGSVRSLREDRGGQPRKIFSGDTGN